MLPWKYDVDSTVDMVSMNTMSTWNDADGRDTDDADGGTDDADDVADDGSDAGDDADDADDDADDAADAADDGADADTDTSDDADDADVDARAENSLKRFLTDNACTAPWQRVVRILQNWLGHFPANDFDWFLSFGINQLIDVIESLPFLPMISIDFLVLGSIRSIQI